MRRRHSLARTSSCNNHDAGLASVFRRGCPRNHFHRLNCVEGKLIREHLALLVCDSLAVDGERILRVVAEPVEEAVGIGGYPGVASVTSELNDDVVLSKGILLNKFLSTSVWKVR